MVFVVTGIFKRCSFIHCNYSIGNFYMY